MHWLLRQERQTFPLLNKEVSENQKLEGNDDAIEQHVKEYGEGYGEYFLDILDLARNINDRRVIPGLIDSIGSGRGVWEALAHFGDDAVSPLIDVFETTKDESKRGDSVDYLIKLCSCEAACHLAFVMPAHAVGDDEEAQFLIYKPGILVVFPLADIRKCHGLKFVAGFVGRSPHVDRNVP